MSIERLGFNIRGTYRPHPHLSRDPEGRRGLPLLRRRRRRRGGRRRRTSRTWRVRGAWSERGGRGGQEGGGGARRRAAEGCGGGVGKETRRRRRRWRRRSRRGTRPPFLAEASSGEGDGAKDDPYTRDLEFNTETVDKGLNVWIILRLF